MVSKTNDIKFSYRNKSFVLDAKVAKSIILELEKNYISANGVKDFLAKIAEYNPVALHKTGRDSRLGSGPNRYEIHCDECSTYNDYIVSDFFFDLNKSRVQCKTCEAYIPCERFHAYHTIVCKKCNLLVNYFEHEKCEGQNGSSSNRYCFIYCSFCDSTIEL